MNKPPSSQFWYDEEKDAVVSNVIKGRYVVTPHRFLHIVTEEYRKVAGKGATAILYAMGFEDGKKIGQAMSDQFNLDKLDLAKYNKSISALSGLVHAGLNYFLDFYKWATVLGFEIDFEGKSAEIKLSDHVFSRYQEGKDESYCDWIRGWVAGIFTVIYKEEMACIEEKCRAYGDPYCKLIIGRKEEILFGGERDR
ncbi:MAG: V4R domain-containing protein [Halobacteriota archaeon]|nr:V4R domain-containing protein [Halobacteriota archaeon]